MCSSSAAAPLTGSPPPSGTDRAAALASATAAALAGSAGQPAAWQQCSQRRVSSHLRHACEPTLCRATPSRHWLHPDLYVQSDPHKKLTCIALCSCCRCRRCCGCRLLLLQECILGITVCHLLCCRQLLVQGRLLHLQQGLASILLHMRQAGNKWIHSAFCCLHSTAMRSCTPTTPKMPTRLDQPLTRHKRHIICAPLVRGLPSTGAGRLASGRAQGNHRPQPWRSRQPPGLSCCRRLSPCPGRWDQLPLGCCWRAQPGARAWAGRLHRQALAACCGWGPGCLCRPLCPHHQCPPRRTLSHRCLCPAGGKRAGKRSAAAVSASRHGQASILAQQAYCMLLAGSCCSSPFSWPCSS